MVVVGDVLLDVDLEGHAQRLAPDAPVPVLDVAGERARPGGAGLAAALLAADGNQVTLVTAVHPDADGERLRALLEPHLRMITGPGDGGTAVKTRMRADGRSLLRADRGDGRVGAGFGDAVAGPLEEALSDAGAVLVSDYGRGVAATPAVRTALERAARRGVPVVWDPHPRGPAPVPGTTVVTPNEAEATGFSDGGAPRSHSPVLAAFAVADGLLRRWESRAVAITMGARGAVVAHLGGGRTASSAPVVAGGDPCGAGDAFAARLAATLAGGAAVDDAVHAAVAAAAEFVERGGAAGFRIDRPVTAPRAMAAGPSGPWCLEEARMLATRVSARGGTVVASGGCFDLLHTGHSRTLAAARALGDCLIVAINSDASVRRLKGPTRPIVPATERAELLMALGCVDAVVVFAEDDPCAVLDVLRPDLWVKGGDYDPAALPETALLRSWGGEVTTVPYRAGRSTTRLLRVAAGSVAGS